MSTRPAPDVDAALVLGMASTALPFTRSAEAEAERWLRILRMHGQAGAALQALGVSEGPIEEVPDEQTQPPAGAERGDMVATVTEGAVGFAAHRGASTVGADDVLVAVIQVYGEDFDNVLRAHGTDRYEVLEQLGVEPQEAGV